MWGKKILMKITIITVCYNASKTIEDTIKSVINQSYKDLEYIIIDGGSTDGTKEIVEKYKKVFPIIFVSEKDNGIYDAMNKGVDLATGEYINFMNADDYFFNKTVIEEVIPFLNTQYDIVYGNMEVRYKNFKMIKIEPEPKYLWMGPVNHQSSFIKREMMKKYMYNVNNKIVADFEFFLTVYYNSGKLLKIDKTIASFSNDGVSQIKDKQVIIDCYKTVKKFRKDLIIEIYYTILKMKPLIKKLLPAKVFKFIRVNIIN